MRKMIFAATLILLMGISGCSIDKPSQYCIGDHVFVGKKILEATTLDQVEMGVIIGHSTYLNNDSHRDWEYNVYCNGNCSWHTSEDLKLFRRLPKTSDDAINQMRGNKPEKPAEREG